MKDYFGKTKEEFQTWLESVGGDESDCGVLAVSPEIYKQWLEASAKHLQEENEDR